MTRAVGRSSSSWLLLDYCSAAMHEILLTSRASSFLPRGGGVETTIRKLTTDDQLKAQVRTTFARLLWLHLPPTPAEATLYTEGRVCAIKFERRQGVVVETKQPIHLYPLTLCFYEVVPVEVGWLDQELCGIPCERPSFVAKIHGHFLLASDFHAATVRARFERPPPKTQTQISNNAFYRYIQSNDPSMQPNIPLALAGSDQLCLLLLRFD
jgi:hypothetical protein